MLAPINFMGIVIRALRGYTHCDPDTHLKLTRPPAPHLLCHYPGDQGHISEGILGRNLFNTTQLCTRIPKGDFPATTRCGSNWFECSHLPRVFYNSSTTPTNRQLYFVEGRLMDVANFFLWFLIY